ncbi:unnamed protein product [Adineta steineri]|uniref:Uncharacterized protein n=1 Tax=Adineta steineri TaxID=433720 RepID=A0A818VII8_9BILA|nr:unnamed protein product [Adineta steineri]
MFSYSNSSLAPPNLHNQNLSPNYSLHKSTPNVAFNFDNQSSQRRLSDSPLLRLPAYNIQYPDEFGGSETCMFKQKNSSLSMLLDSTSSMMRTASTTFQYLIGSARRASYCGQPDPTIQLSSTGNSGSLYLFPGAATSNESSISNVSYEDQRRTVTIYDGRIPGSSATPTIPFELMTPLDAITQTVDDPVESFVQIVLEEPDDRPPVMLPLSSSRRNSTTRHRHRSISPNSLSNNDQLTTSEKTQTDTKSLPITNSLNSLKIHSQLPEVIEPMDFSFLDPVLRGESAAPPPVRTQNIRRISLQNNLKGEDSLLDLQPLSRSIPMLKDDLTLSSAKNNYHSITSTSRLKVPSSND